jgi:hypothetical protein
MNAALLRRVPSHARCARAGFYWLAVPLKDMLRFEWVAHSGILFIAGIEFENHELGIFL